VLHHEAPWLAEQAVVGVERGADGAAAVAGGRLHVELLERRLPEDAAVGDAVERDAAGERQPRQPRLRVGRPRHRQQHILVTAWMLAATSA